MADDAEVEAFFEATKARVSAALEEAIGAMCLVEPADPIAYIGEYLLRLTPAWDALTRPRLPAARQSSRFSQSIGKREKLLKDMVPDLEDELREQMDNEGVATDAGVEFVISKFMERVDSVMAKDTVWFNDDANFEAALGGLLKAVRGIVKNATKRVLSGAKE